MLSFRGGNRGQGTLHHGHQVPVWYVPPGDRPAWDMLWVRQEEDGQERLPALCDLSGPLPSGHTPQEVFGEDGQAGGQAPHVLADKESAHMTDTALLYRCEAKIKVLENKVRMLERLVESALSLAREAKRDALFPPRF